jgi:hypothetical protein
MLMRSLALILVLAFVDNIVAQVVTIKSDVLNIPRERRTLLIERLHLYLAAIDSHDVAALFDLVHPRTRKGLSRTDFASKTKTYPEEQRILKFQITRITKATEDEYIDEPKPNEAEGEKWFVDGCTKIELNGKKAKQLLHGFDVWFLDGNWYIRRGGSTVENGGYVECTFK